MNKDLIEELTFLKADYCKNHNIKAVYHKMNLESLDYCYKNFYGDSSNFNLSKKICKKADYVNFESLQIYEKFLGE